MKSISKVICVIIGTLVGAGFASGREIYVFFNEYGDKGLYGLVISIIITGSVIYSVLISIKEEDIENYEEYLVSLKINSKIKDVLNIIINIFLLISFYTMIAGFCAYFKQEFHVPYYITAILVGIMCFFTFKSNMKGIIKINSVLIPILIFIILIMGIKSNFLYSIDVLGEKNNQKRMANCKFRIYRL